MVDKKPLYSKIVIIYAEGTTEVVPFERGREKEAEEYFKNASESWSDSYLCTVERGPTV
jgi:hypothetical protein